MIDEGVNAALAASDANRTGDDSHTSGTGVRRTERVTRECTYQDFMKCQPLYFKGTEEVVKLTQWSERMETVFRISNCLAENQVKFATCTLLAGALTWWNSYVRIVGNDAAYVMTWIELKKKMTDKLQTRGSLKILPETTKADNSLLKHKMWQGHTLQDLEIGNRTNPDANTITGTFLLNNCYASVLFDTGADRSFVSTAFSF
nr:hypothetical protein [Tanacetum cinerariifolium]